jgi:hypothetical protein
MTPIKNTLSQKLASITLAVAISVAMSIAGTGRASGIITELAKTCDALTAKAFPPRQIGNPAAGSAKGNSKAQREYYKKCATNGGKVDKTENK